MPNGGNMQQIEVVFEEVEINREEAKMRLNKAFEILLDEILKDRDLKSLFFQNLYPRVGSPNES